MWYFFFVIFCYFSIETQINSRLPFFFYIPPTLNFSFFFYNNQNNQSSIILFFPATTTIVGKYQEKKIHQKRKGNENRKIVFLFCWVNKKIYKFVRVSKVTSQQTLTFAQERRWKMKCVLLPIFSDIK